ncbi:MAG: indole-3-glycerol phosphate synthase TrpC [Ilumatobacteraceae bacterium]|nr:indole-3-glycerol phosphate synthase TrpC [Ilumatobacteraceae bacterium]
MTHTYLDDIVAWHRQRAHNDTRLFDELLAEAKSCVPTRGFASSIRAMPHLAVIAEIKRRSPSKGDLNANLDPAELAAQYQRGGASCLSVLTDSNHFGGSVSDLQKARAACSVPVIRKDFTVDARDVCDARIMGADCVLLIAAVLTPAELSSFLELCREVDIDALVEVHDETELDVAMGAGATMVGVNQRDLVTFAVDQARAVRMAPLIPDNVVKVAESGVRGREDAIALKAAGYDAILVGEHLVMSQNPEAALTELCVE